MARRQGKKNTRRLVVIVRHVATPDGKSRLAQAARLLLMSEGSTAAMEKGVGNTNDKPTSTSFSGEEKKHDIAGDPEGGS